MKRPFLFFFIVLFVGCVQHGNLNPEQLLYNTKNSEVILVDEAVAELDKLIDRFASNTTTKSIIPKVYSKDDIIVFGAKDLAPFTKNRSSIELPDTLIYIVNFEQNNGFAVMSANRRVGNIVYCITDNGAISSADFSYAYELLSETSQPVVKTNNEDYEFTSMGPDFIPAIILSSVLSSLETGPTINDESTVSTKSFVPEGLLETRWEQGEPFNNRTPNGAAPGCVVIAVAQIMAYNEFSIDMSYDYKDCQWSTMKTVFTIPNIYSMGSAEAQDQVAAFAYELGKSYHCNVRYENGSWAQADGAARALRNYGYSNVNKYIGFGTSNQKKARAALDLGYPVYLDGCKSGSTTEGHAWVIDGYDGDYFHCNFGWHGNGDGLYYKNTFNPLGNNYTWWFRLITYTT